MAELVYRPVVGFAQALFKAWDLKIDCKGSENIPRSGGAVLVSNHISYLDFVFNGLAALPQKRLVRFMAKESVFRHKVSGPLMRGMKHIPVDRTQGETAYAHALESLRSGEIVGVFPEATISQSFTLKSFKSGAARMAQEAGVPLIPMAVWGTQRLWTKGHPRNFKRSHLPITMRVGEAIEASRDKYAGAITRQVRERVNELLEAAQRAYPVRPKGPDDTWWMPPSRGYGAYSGAGARGRGSVATSIRAPGLNFSSSSASSVAAFATSASGIGAMASSRKTPETVCSVSLVRGPWRQFQRRQVTPTSSRQTTSPGSGCSTTSSPCGHGHEVLVTGGPDETHPAPDAVEVLAADGDEVRDADRVVEVDQEVDAGQPRVRQRPLRQRLRRVAGARRLRAERRVDLPPGRHVRVLVRGAPVQPYGEPHGPPRRAAPNWLRCWARWSVRGPRRRGA